MNRFYRLGLLGLLVLGMGAVGARAQDQTTDPNEDKPFSKVGVGMGNFLNIPVGARAVGMGAGFGAIADDPTALYWNPAGITQNEGVSASYGFTSLFAGIDHNFAGVTFQIGQDYRGGVSAISYGSDDIPVTTLFNPEGTGATYRASDLALGLSFAGKLTDQFSFGVTGKFINMQIASLSANGVAFDASTLYKPGIAGLRLGFAIQNLSTNFKYSGSNLSRSGGFDENTGNQNSDVQVEPLAGNLPLTFRAGLATEQNFSEDLRLLAGFDFSTASDRSEFYGIGAELLWNNLIAVRAGYQAGTEDAFGLSGGIGVRYQVGSFLGQIDYAVRPHSTLGLVNMINATVVFQ